MQEYIEKSATYTQSILNELRNRIAQTIHRNDATIVVVGSFGRCEASEESDFDFFVIHRDRTTADSSLVSVATSIISDRGLKSPSEGGPFSQDQYLEDMLHRIGGQDDANENMTCRMLFFSESNWVYNQDMYLYAQKQLIERYVEQRVGAGKIPMFLLNDLIRYYRTMTVDFDFKTREQGKPWGIRYIKLIFSRKLLYFGALIAIAESIPLSRNDKIERLAEMLTEPPITRLRKVFGERCDRAVTLYDTFLRDISSPTVRSELSKLTSDERESSSTFQRMREKGHEFRTELISLLTERYGPDSRLFQSLIM